MIYWLAGIAICGLLVSHTFRHWLPGCATAAALLIAWWQIVPTSTAPSGTQHLESVVWIDARGLAAVKAAGVGTTIAYGENGLVRDCQQQLGTQLLQFEKIDAVIPYVGHTAGVCQTMAPELRPFYRNSTRMSRGRDTGCLPSTHDYFGDLRGRLACVDIDTNRYAHSDWKVFLNCSQRKKEYQLRAIGPNLLTGGGGLETFSGVNFWTGECLDPRHRRWLEDLLDVVGLGPGRRVDGRGPL